MKKKKCEQMKSEHLQNSEHFVTIGVHDLLEFIFWARRYCDGRSTYAPSSFNQTYENIVQLNPNIKEKDQFDPILTDKGAYWPYAQDSMHNASTGAYDARPISLKKEVSDEGLSI